MAASVKIDQAAAPAGVPGQAREDLVTGLAVTLTASGGPFSQYQWLVDYRAIDAGPSGLSRATSALTAPTASVTQLTPVDKRGTYRGRLLVDSGAGLGAGVDDVAEWSFYAGVSGDPVKGSPAADPTKLPRRTIAAGERAAHNVPDLLDPGGNPDGWARERLRWDSVAELLFALGVRAVAVVTLTGGGAVVSRQAGVLGAARAAQGVVTVSWATAFPDALYAAAALPVGPVGGMASVSSRLAGSCVVERADVGGSLVDADFVVLAMLGFGL